MPFGSVLWPGHTPEHISFLLTDGGFTTEAGYLLSGDFVFVGDLGRPDLLDEAAGRVLTQRNLWMATARLDLRYRQPVPIGQPLTVVGEIVRLKSRSLEAHGEIRLADGTVAVEATGIYVKIPEERLQGLQEELQFWQVIPDNDARS